MIFRAASTAKRVVGTILLAGLTLTACGKAETNDLTLPENTRASGRVEDQFGKEFGEAFRADPNSTPANVSEDDVVPVSLDTEPVPID